MHGRHGPGSDATAEHPAKLRLSAGIRQTSPVNRNRAPHANATTQTTVSYFSRQSCTPHSWPWPRGLHFFRTGHGHLDDEVTVSGVTFARALYTAPGLTASTPMTRPILHFFDTTSYAGSHRCRRAPARRRAPPEAGG